MKTNKKQPQPRDMLVILREYNLENKSILVEDDGNRLFEIKINADAYARGVKSEGKLTTQPKWVGHDIDARMQKAVKENSHIILEKVVLSRTITKDGKKIYLAEAQRVHNVTNPNPKKTFNGIFTISANMDGNINRVTNVQSWDDTAIDIGDDEAIANLNNRLNKVTEIFESGSYCPTIGVQFRAYVPSTESDVRHTTIDRSPTYDYIPAKKDEKGNIIEKGKPLTSEKFTSILAGYINYINSNEEYQKLGVVVEVTTYTSYRASTMSKSLVISSNQYDPLNILSNTPTKCAIGDEDYLQGKNWGVVGIVKITSDKVREENDQFVKEPRHMVNQLFANGIKADVQSFIKTSKGEKCTTHKDLRPSNLKKVNKENIINQNHELEDMKSNPVVEDDSVDEDMSAIFGTTTEEVKTVEQAPEVAEVDPFLAELEEEVKEIKPSKKENLKKTISTLDF